MNKLRGISVPSYGDMIGCHPLNPYGLANWFVLIVGILLIAVTPLDWIFPSGTRATELGVENADRAIPQFARGVILLLLIVYVGLTGWDPGAYGFAPGRAMFVLVAYMFISVFFYSSGSTSRFFVFVKSMMWFAAAVASYRLTLGGYLSLAKIRYVAGVLVVIASAYTIPFCLDPGRRIGQNADASLLVWCIPLLLLSHPPLWALALSGLASIAVLVTIKRGAILALFAGAVVYSILSFRMSSGDHKVRDCIIVALVMVTITVGLIWQWENLEYRMEKDLDRGEIGSGRSWLYRVIISEWYNANISCFLFGRGFFTVLDILDQHGERVYAHSDWLEILHDTGLFGCLLFAYLHLSILRVIRQSLRQREPAAPALTMGYCIFALRTVYSQCLVGGGCATTLYFGLLLGYAAAICVLRSPSW